MKGASARSPGRPKDLEKRSAIMGAAGRLFLEHGFDRTTVDAIAAQAGVSKLTVYSHFHDKESLFKALIANKCEEYFNNSDFDKLKTLPPAVALTQLAQGFVGLIYNQDVLALYRLLIGGAAKDPKTSRAFYDAGPAPMASALAELLRHYNGAGSLQIADPMAAGEHLLSLLQGCTHFRVLLDIDAPPPMTARHRIVKDCVAVFLRAYTLAP